MHVRGLLDILLMCIVSFYSLIWSLALTMKKQTVCPMLHNKSVHPRPQALSYMHDTEHSRAVAHVEYVHLWPQRLMCNTIRSKDCTPLFRLYALSIS